MYDSIDAFIACSRLSVVGDERKRVREKNEGGLGRGLSLSPPLFFLLLLFSLVPSTESLEQANTFIMTSTRSYITFFRQQAVFQKKIPLRQVTKSLYLKRGRLLCFHFDFDSLNYISFCPRDEKAILTNLLSFIMFLIFW